MNEIEEEKNNTKKQSSRETNENRKNEEVVKITVSKEAEIQLLKVLERVNNGFDGGRVNRQDLASWALVHFAQECSSETVKAIRQDHYDEFTYLESILRKAKESGLLPQEIKNVLKQQIGIDSQPRKPTKKSVASTYINDVTSKIEGNTEMNMDSL